MDCSEKIYHRNEYGFTSKCECHHAIHLTFGNISLLLSKLQLIDFAEYLADTIMIFQDDGLNLDQRDIYMPTRDPSLMFMMSCRELSGLLELAEHTLVMLQVEDVLSSP
jgi:hypothetical protein